jgi:Bcl-2-related ovarian killer protein
MNTWETLLDTTLRVYWSVKDRLVSLKLKDPPVAAIAFRFVQTPMMAEVVEQSKILCEDYIFSRLTAVLLYPNDPNDPPRLGAKVKAWKNRRFPSDVSMDIQRIGAELESTYPSLYVNLSSQIGMPLRSDIAVRKAMIYIGDFMFRNSVVTWGRIIGLFAVAAAVARECVQNKRGNQVPIIVKVVSELIERHAAIWICRQGGWVAIVKALRSVKEARYMWILTVVGAISGFAITWSLPIEFC